MIRPTRAAATLKVGEPIPPYERSITTIDLVAYGAATWDWHRLHYDGDYARSMKLPNVIVDGQMFGAVFAKVALDWLGPRAFVRRLSLKYRSMVFPGDTIRTEGEVSAIRAEADHDVAIVVERMKVADRVVAEATLEIRLPR